MIIKNKIIVFLLFGVSLLCAQQQGLYTNIFLHQYLYNPAYIATINGQQYNVGYRNQWVGFEDAPRTAVLTGYGNLKKKPNVALGGMIVAEHLGLIDNVAGYATYAYHLKLNKKAAINFGLSAGAVQYSIKAYNAVLYDQDDSYLNSEVLTAWAFDANAGVYFYTQNFFFGFSDQHLPNAKIKWNNSLGRLTSCYYAYTGYNFRLGEKKEWVIQPSLLIRSNPPAPYQVEVNLRTTYKDMVWIGFNYRQNASSSAMIGCTIEKQFMVAYAYDYALSALSNYSSGTHEIMLSYYIPFKKKRSKSEQVGDADEEELNTIDNSIKTSIKNQKEDEQKNESKPEGTDKPKEPEQNQEPKN